MKITFFFRKGAVCIFIWMFSLQNGYSQDTIKEIPEAGNVEYDSSFSLVEALPAESKLFDFHGFQGYEFTFQGRNAKVVVPKQTATGRPWNWRARFWGGEPQTDIALLERGFHLAYCDISESFANEEALSIWNDFYNLLYGAGLAKKSTMEGMSRGGVYIYRWAVAYPGRVAAIYADAPVLDLKSWPGGKGKGSGSPEDWDIFKKDFGLKSEEEAVSFKGNPLDWAEQIAATGIPLLHVVGDADEVVPVDENTAPFEQKIKKAGGSIQVIHKPGVGHHPHSLKNPQPIVDFLLQATQATIFRSDFTKEENLELKIKK
jgi:pimeloyl-ACP methyl ester carboxylesterase